ncbi:Amino acid permease/ SLC12A domain-containing protein [Plasmodiophora brassicae]
MSHESRTRPDTITGAESSAIEAAAHPRTQPGTSAPVLGGKPFAAALASAPLPLPSPSADKDEKRCLPRQFLATSLMDIAKALHDEKVVASVCQDTARLDDLRHQVVESTQALFGDAPIEAPRKGVLQSVCALVRDPPYPVTCDTPAKRLEEYYKRRRLPSDEVSMKLLLGLGVCSVIFGEFSGWNAGVAAAGYVGFWLANLAASLLYLSLALCLGELTQAVPPTGGANAYARAVFRRPEPAIVVGMAEAMEYLLFTCLLLSSFSGLMSQIYEFSTAYSPLVWLVMLSFAGYSVAFCNRLSWNLMYIGMVFCALQIVGFAAVWSVSGYVSSAAWLSVGWPDGTTYQQMLFGSGFVGFCQAVPTSLWFYTGFECLSSCTVESPVKKDVPRALIGSWMYLSTCAILLSATSVLIRPGTYAMSQALYPYVTAVMAFAPVQYVGIALLLCVIPSLLFNLLAMLFCASRQIWAMSRIGFLPTALSLTHRTDRTPRNAVAATCVFAFFVTLALFYATPSKADSILMNLTILSACVQYVVIAATYIGFRAQYPSAPREFQNPLGNAAPVIVIVFSAVTIVVYLASSILFLYCVFVYAAFIGSLYLAWRSRKQPLYPSAEAYMPIFWR